MSDKKVQPVLKDLFIKCRKSHHILNTITFFSAKRCKIKLYDLKKVGKFVNDVLSGKINNKYDAEDEHNKNIKNDNDYLGNVNIRTEDRKETKRII